MVTFLKDGLASASPTPLLGSAVAGYGNNDTFLWSSFTRTVSLTHSTNDDPKQTPERKKTSRSAGRAFRAFLKTSPSVAGGQPGRRRAASGRVRRGRVRRARGFSGPPGRWGGTPTPTPARRAPTALHCGQVAAAQAGQRQASAAPVRA